MAVSLDCPGMECWQALFRDALPPEQRARYEGHLESCPACQDRLDRAEEFEDPLRSRARRVGDPTTAPPDPTLAEVLERLHEVKSAVRSAPEEQGDLYFLRPADRPGVLGMLGKYEVRAVVGRGGMGVVLEAFDPALDRLVAIKVMAAAVAGSATARRRFSREAQAVAAISHEHVVAVHEVHDNDGLPYLVMQYVAGESLQARLDRAGPLELAEVVRIGQQAALGLAAAHARGLIHRDVKPANLLLEDGSAKVKVTDFGLARTADDLGLTQTGVVAGTPEYIAPEQARGEPLDHRADLFSLGSVLYALCTGFPPFRGSTPLDVLRQVSEQAPRPVREQNPDVPAWLETLIARLLAKDPEERFQSAAEVAALLEGYLAHLQQPTRVNAPELPAVRGPGPGKFPPSDLRHGVSRNVSPLLWPALLVLLAALGLVALLGFSGGDGTPKQSRHAPTAPDVRLTGVAVDADQFPDGIPSAPAAATPAASPREPGRRGWLTALAVCAVLSLLALGVLGVWFFVRRSRGTGAEDAAAAGPDRQARPEAAARAISFPCPACAAPLKARAELAGKKLRCPRCGQAVDVPETTTGGPPPAARATRKSSIAKVWWGAGLVGLVGLILAVVFLSGRPAVYQPGERPSFLNVTVGGEAVPEVEEAGFQGQEFNKGQPFRWTDGNGRLVIPFDRTKPPEALLVRLANNRLSGVKKASLTIAVNGRSLFAGDLPSGPWERVFDLHGLDLGEQVVLELTSDSFIPGGQAAGGDPRQLGVQVMGVKLLREGDKPAADPVRTIGARAQLGEVSSQGIVFGGLTADGKVLVSGSWAGTVKVWNLATNPVAANSWRVGPNLNALAVSPDGRTFATATTDRVVRVWVDTGARGAAFAGHKGQVLALAYAPDGKTLASAGDDNVKDGELKLWDLARGTERVPIEPFPFRLWGLAYAPDGQSVAVVGGDRTAQLVDTGTGQVRTSFALPFCGRHVAFSPDGQLLAVAYGEDGWVRLYELDSGRPRADFQVPGGKRLYGLHFAPDGKRLLTPAADGATILWDVSAPQARAVARLAGHEGPVWFALFFPDGHTVATGGEDGTVRRWTVDGTE